MYTLKKIIKYIGIGILVLFLGIGIYLYNSGPQLPDNANRIIEDVLKSPLPELVKGNTGLANSGGINIWYENISPKQKQKGTVLLIMGISNDALGWPQGFINTFIEAGYQVIRYDHRGTGLSDWQENFDDDHPYSLSDMADDAISILDTLKIKKAHILGVSMGGMIAQQLAINHPQRVHSLTSIMSSGNIYDQEIPPISSKIAMELIKVAIKYSIISSEKNMIKLHLASRMILMGESANQIDIKSLSEQVLYNIRKRKGFNPNASKQHQIAVSISDSRYGSLKKLKIPILIIHGKNDPFIPIEHGKKCLRLIPDADSLWVDNMGHDIPDELTPIISHKIISKFDLVSRQNKHNKIPQSD